MRIGYSKTASIIPARRWLSGIALVSWLFANLLVAQASAQNLRPIKRTITDSNVRQSTNQTTPLVPIIRPVQSRQQPVQRQGSLRRFPVNQTQPHAFVPVVQGVTFRDGAQDQPAPHPHSLATIDQLGAQHLRAVVYEQEVFRQAPPTVQRFHQSAHWELDLNEAIRIALINNRDIAIFGYEPDHAYNNINFATYRFDTQFEANQHWSVSQARLENNIDVFGTGATFQRTERYAERTGRPDQLAITQNLKSGGNVRLSLSTGYQRAIPAGAFNTLNPTWRTSTTLQFNQPLGQGSGRRIVLMPFQIAKATKVMSDISFESRINKLVRDVEFAYWNMWFSRQNLEVRRKELEKARKVYQKELEKLAVGESSRPAVGEAKLAYYYSVDNYQARKGELLEDERSFRALLGIQGFDDRRIFVKSPAVFPDLQVDWKSSLATMLTLRPEIKESEYSSKISKMRYIQARDFCRPDINFEARLSKNGLAERLDDSVSRMVDDPDYSWLVGFSMNGTAARTREKAEARRAYINYQQALARERKTVHDSTHRLQNSYTKLFQRMEKIRVTKGLREAAAERLAAYTEQYDLGELSIELFLRAQADNADMVLRELRAKVELMQAVTDFEYVRGTLLQSRSIEFGDHAPQLTPATNRESDLLQAPRSRRAPNAPRQPDFEDLIKDLPSSLKEELRKPFDPRIEVDRSKLKSPR